MFDPAIWSKAMPAIPIDSLATKARLYFGEGTCHFLVPHTQIQATVDTVDPLSDSD